MTKKKKLGGLVLKKPDVRNLKLGNVYTLPKLETLPQSFMIDVGVKHQHNSDFCTAFMSTLMSEPQEKTELEPSWSFAKSKEISGDPEAYGQDLVTALKVHTKYGALPSKDSPFNLQNKSDDFLRDIKNWPNLESKVEPYRKKSFFEVTGQYDAFDNIRASLVKFNSPIGLGVIWSWSLSDKVIKDYRDSGFGHAVTAVGYKTINNEPYIAIQNSYGKEAGENGIHWFSRNVINHFVDLYGSYCFVDLPLQDAKFLNKWHLSPSWKFLAKLANGIKNYLMFFLK